MNTIDKVLVGLVIFLIIFVITMIVLFCIYQDIPNTLVECVFSCAGCEAIITFAIWHLKRKSNKKEETK